MSSSEDDVEDNIPLSNIAKALKQSAEEYEKKQAILQEHTKRLLQLLQNEGMLLMKGTEDGDCFMRATAMQTNSSPDEIRSQICDFLVQNRSELKDFVPPETLDAEVALLRKPGVWNLNVCDSLPLVVANMLDRPIRIFSSNIDCPVIDVVPKEKGSDANGDMLYYVHYAIKGNEHYDWGIPFKLADVQQQSEISCKADSMPCLGPSDSDENKHSVPKNDSIIDFGIVPNADAESNLDFDPDVSLQSLDLDSSVTSIGKLDTSFVLNNEVPTHDIKLSDENDTPEIIDPNFNQPDNADTVISEIPNKQDGAGMHKHKAKRTTGPKSKKTITQILNRIKERTKQRQLQNRKKYGNKSRKSEDRETKTKAKKKCKEMLAGSDVPDDSDRDESYRPSPIKANRIRNQSDNVQINDRGTNNNDSSSQMPETPPSPMKERSRKRIRDESKWKQKARKRKRSCGLEYETKMGKTVQARKVQPALCRHKYPCTDKISEAKRQKLHDAFWQPRGSPYVQQRLFISTNVSQKPTVRKTKEGSSRRKNTIKYSLPVCEDKDVQKISVCKTFFLKTLDINQSWVYSALEKTQQNGILEDDKRGKHTSHKLPSSYEEDIKSHINSFPTVAPHYTRKKSTRKYLESNMTLSKMYRLYKIECNSKGTKPCSATKYAQVFNSFNIGFHRPKKDQCSTCNKYQNSTSEDQKTMQASYNAHLELKESARKAKNADKQKAHQDDTFVSFNFDKQAVLQSPKLYDKQIYYKRKLNTYNETAYDVRTKVGRCWIWHESEGGRGSNEIATCLFRNIKQYPNATHITMFSDTCGGENRNSQMSTMCMHAVQQMPNLEVLEQKYFEPGHSEMEADSMHSAIYTASKKAQIQTPFDWDNVIRLARHKSAPYVVERLTHADFINWKEYSKEREWQNFTHNTKKERVHWLRIRQIRYTKSKTGCFEYKYSFNEDEEYMQVQTLACRRSDRNVQSLPFTEMALPLCYQSELPISVAKKNDLLDLCSQSIIAKEHHTFYQSLLTCKKVETLDQPDKEESDTEETDV